MDGALGGWQLTAIDTMTSGLPINITYSPTGQFQVSGAVSSAQPGAAQPGDTRGPANHDTYLNQERGVGADGSGQPFGNAGTQQRARLCLLQLDLGLHKEFALGARAPSCNSAPRSST